MNRIAVLDNTIQHYAWGSRCAIASLMGRPVPSEKPEAELWMGAHPKASSRVENQTLLSLIETDPVGLLGPQVAGKFNGRLPFLFKLLAAGTPLSIQAHPNLAQAREGFARENAAGIPPGAPERNYKDDNHKPEILCALTPFWALNGFRPVAQILDILDKAGCAEIAPERALLSASPTRDGLRVFFRALLELPPPRRERLLEDLVRTARARRTEKPEYNWIARIHEMYPGDIGVMCVLLLNLVKLEPGTAMFCAAGDLHAYLDGFGVELMANSDNVLRGGLTPKHVDIAELLRTLTFSDAPARILQAENGVYRTPVDEFLLSRIDVNAGHRWMSDTVHSLEILVNVRGAISVLERSGTRLDISPGSSVIVPASAGVYEITGDGCVYRASVPQLNQ